MPFDFEPHICRALHQARFQVWAQAFAAELLTQRVKLPMAELDGCARQAVAALPALELEHPALAARLWVEHAGLPR